MATLFSSSPPSLPLHPTHLDAIAVSTSPTSTLTPSPATTSASSPTTSRSIPGTMLGRCKAQHWSREMPPSGKSGGGAPSRSFKEVLLAAASVVSSDSVSAPPASPLCSTSPRILLRPADSRQPPSRRSLDAGGRQEVESQRSRKTRLRAEREQRRRVPADLRGLCFNYFSPNHRVGACNNRTRCFKCWLTGRRAYWCPFFE
ncbi:CASP-like protein 4U1 [Panicum virgatum]|uniref:CASP-like protein 4U1 n=1 Tax=Panicum virgatum TaxID=38727 RepID=UPI0019D5A369|nr:CASP-like protein 4U1 [Panicum virgatum]